MKQKTDTILSAADVSVGATSEVVDLRYSYGFAAVTTFTGAPTGNVVIEGSIDQTTWVQINSQAISGTTPVFLNQDAIYYPYVRVFKAGGGTGTMTTKISFKGP